MAAKTFWSEKHWTQILQSFDQWDMTMLRKSTYKNLEYKQLSILEPLQIMYHSFKKLIWLW